ncbi:MAG: surface lipoprotein assembly modifier [Pseudomonadota bacterium]
MSRVWALIGAAAAATVTAYAARSAPAQGGALREGPTLVAAADIAPEAPLTHDDLDLVRQTLPGDAPGDDNARADAGAPPLRDAAPLASTHNTDAAKTGARADRTALTAAVGPDGRVKMTGENALVLAEDLYEAGELDAAASILTALENADAAQIDQTQVAFLSGLIAGAKGDHKSAVERFRAILDERPDIVRVRLELARSLFALKRDQAAVYHFRLALADGLPPEVEANIRVFLTLIENRRIWRVNASAGLAPDSNISAGPKDRVVELFGLPFELDDNARERSGLGFSSSLSAEFFPKLSRHWRAELRGGGSITDYENIQFDDVFLFTEAGPRFTMKGFSASVLGAFSRRFFGGDGFSTSVGGKVALAKGLSSRTQMFLRFSGAKARYDIDTRRNGPVYSAGVRVAHAIDRASTVQAGLTATREQTRDPVFRNTQYLLNGSYRRELPYGLTVQAGPDLYYRDFNNFDPLNGNIRSDWTFGGSIFITKRDWRIMGFAPVFSYQYLHNASNADRFDYTRHRANIGLTRTF